MVIEKKTKNEVYPPTSAVLIHFNLFLQTGNA